MRISCPSCGASQELELESGVGAAKAKCGACGTSFLVRVKSRGKSGGAGVPVFNWYVRKPDGVLLSFPGDAQLHEAIQRGAVGVSDEISADGRSWSQISGLPILKAFMERWSRSESGSFGVIAPEGTDPRAAPEDLQDTRGAQGKEHQSGTEGELVKSGSGGGVARGQQMPAVVETPRLPAAAETPRLPAAAETPRLPAAAEGAKTGVWSAAEMAAAAAALRPVPGTQAQGPVEPSGARERRREQDVAPEMDDPNRTVLGVPVVPPELPTRSGSMAVGGRVEAGASPQRDKGESPWGDPWGDSADAAPLPPTRVEQPAVREISRENMDTGSRDIRPLVTGVGFPAESGEPMPKIQPVAVAAEVKPPRVDPGEEEWERALAAPEYSEETGQILLHPGGRRLWRWGLVGGLVAAGLLAGVLVGRSCGRTAEEGVTGTAPGIATVTEAVGDAAARANETGGGVAVGGAEKGGDGKPENRPEGTDVGTGGEKSGQETEEGGAPGNGTKESGAVLPEPEISDVVSGVPEGKETAADVGEAAGAATDVGQTGAGADAASQGAGSGQTAAAMTPGTAPSRDVLPMPSLRREPIQRDSPATPAVPGGPDGGGAGSTKTGSQPTAKPVTVARQAGSARPAEGDRKSPAERPEPVVRGGDFETLLARGNQAYKARKYAEATAHFRKATEVNPRNPVGHHKLGDSLMQTGKLDDAAQAYQQAIDLTGYAPAFMGMARVLERKGQIAKAISTLEAAMEQHPGHTGIQRLLDSLKGR